MRISRRSRSKSKRKLGRVIGYQINGLVHHPNDVTILYGKPRQPVRRALWHVWKWIRLHRKGLLIILLIIVLCTLTAIITAHHPT